jgi:purine-nucleoside/S-methyl-5'-thioadenosine phosphorylase / adenosine deaminase
VSAQAQRRVGTIELELEGAHVAFSTRVGGVSEGSYESLNLGILTDDDPARVRENRERLAGRLGLDPQRVAMGWQVHGAELCEWTAPPDGAGFQRPADLPQVDAHLTRLPDVALLVLVADCLPLALASDQTVAMVHCGWRGLAAGIVERAVAAFDDAPAAAIGPGIGPCCYEVGDDVLHEFAHDDAARGQMLDLRAIVRHRLERAGVRTIESVDLCTSCNPDRFFSHRRDGGVTGRQAGLVWRAP